jgi:hypothetical protein
MSFSVRIDHPRRFVHVRPEGEVRASDAEAFLDALVVESAMPYRKLIDSRSGEARYIAADIERLTARMKLYDHVDRRGAAAIVVDPKQRDRVEQFLELGRPQRPGRTFLDPSEAECWLEQQPET